MPRASLKCTYSSSCSNRNHDENVVHGASISLNSSSSLVALQFSDVVDILSDVTNDLGTVLAGEILAQIVLERLLEDRGGHGDTQNRSGSPEKIRNLRRTISAKSISRCRKECLLR